MSRPSHLNQVRVDKRKRSPVFEGKLIHREGVPGQFNIYDCRRSCPVAVSIELAHKGVQSLRCEVYRMQVDADRPRVTVAKLLVGNPSLHSERQRH